MLADAETVKRESRGRWPTSRTTGCLPRSVGVLIAVRDVVSKLLERNDLTVADVDHFELNEAFAAQMVYVADELDIPAEKHNPLGGAVRSAIQSEPAAASSRPRCCMRWSERIIIAASSR